MAKLNQMIFHFSLCCDDVSFFPSTMPTYTHYNEGEKRRKAAAEERKTRASERARKRRKHVVLLHIQLHV